MTGYSWQGFLTIAVVASLEMRASLVYTLCFAIAMCNLCFASMQSQALEVDKIPSISKTVISTPWWPPGTEKSAESIGILSRGKIFLTGMMENNKTDAKTAEQEMLDVRDILVGGNSSLAGLLRCMVNTPIASTPAEKHSIRKDFRKAFVKLGIQDVLIDFVEMIGEYDGHFRFQTTCVGVQPSKLPKRHLQTNMSSSAVLYNYDHKRSSRSSREAEMYLHSQGNSTDAVLLSLKQIFHDSSLGNMGDSLVDCEAFTKTQSQNIDLRKSLMELKNPPTVTALVVKNITTSDIKLHCFARIGSGPPLAVEVSPTVRFVKSGGLIYTDGIYATDADGLDGFDTLRETLVAAGSSMAQVVNCLFYIKNASNVDPLFQRFYKVFNVNNPPPPSRTEYSSHLPEPYNVMIKCIASEP